MEDNNEFENWLNDDYEYLEEQLFEYDYMD